VLATAISAVDAYIEGQGADAHQHTARHWQACRHMLLSLSSLIDFKQAQPAHYVFTGRRRGAAGRGADATIAFSVARTAKNVLHSFIVNRRRFMPQETGDSLNCAIAAIHETYFD